MFTRQAPPILNALWIGGLSPASASAIQNLLGQCRAPLYHNGPVTIDYTRNSMRTISPDSAQFEFPPMDLPQPEQFPPQEDDEPELPPEHDPTEPPPDYGPGETPSTPSGPVGPGGAFYSAGNYLQLDPSLRFSLRARDSKRHAVFPLGLNAAGEVHSVEFKGYGDPEDYVELNITDNEDSTDFTVKFKGFEPVDILTDAYIQDNKLFFTRKSCLVFGLEDQDPVEIELTDCADAPPEEPPA